MALVKIPAGHHVVRHCKRKHAIRHNGEFVGVFPEFFYLREGESYLSAFYFEFFDPDDEARMNSCVMSMPFGTKPREAMVKLDAEAMRQTGKSLQFNVRVVHEQGHKTIPSKAQVLGLPSADNERLGAELAANAVVDWHVFT